ncbi:cysteine desulfurase family protein [Methylotenera sp.]|uniref:cysteine desulfurase family protein n=1 Tax=Methylotenera sp. TaxID=2051956 RepID=UPI00271BCB55|nr:cysteine desulfurase family protein [Methylotenera sp.]MDO9205125.1 cysteine desulfurase family protein [Methylotenera sp.]MDO9394140.1 cysteine desulfurase family protein [Methylotenera sp.]MDP1522230.1 cysteine desulfurase family protein [Methylotenera sp.]MDP2071021.1 cysteine desulfurase family protein [Methylotenera sp.]MDP3005895.1 cysteine desulfurase family protein [Methylotenera sp.]
MASVYFDHNATTALDSTVLEAMLPWMQTQSGNPTSRHSYGRRSRDAIEHARAQVAEACGAYSSQVVFTSCGTEANNFAVKGIVGIKPAVTAQQILTSAVEHPCVTRPALAMQSLGYVSRHIAVDANGKVDLEQLKSQLVKSTGLVSVMLANNETGVIQNIASIADVVRNAGAFMHTDAVQGLGKIELNFADLNVHAMTVSSHKIHGPQGAAALILDKRVDIQPLLHGGGQEKGLRSGTENVAAIVGFGAACELAIANQKHFAAHTQALREQFEQGLKSLNVTIFGDQASRLPNTSFFAIDDIEGETLVMALDRKGYAVASGSACSSDSTKPSHVLLAMGVHADIARGAVRVSFGAGNTSAQVTDFLATLSNEILRLKQLTSIAA